MSDTLRTLVDFRALKQLQAIDAAGTPEAAAYLAEAKRYGLAIDRIMELETTLRHVLDDFCRYDMPGDSAVYTAALRVLEKS